MKKIVLLGAIISSLVACSSFQEKSPIIDSLPNPASRHCNDQGGRLEIRNESNGQIGYCHLDTGQVVEEWKFFFSGSSIAN